MLTREYLVHSWTSYLDVFPIGLSLISRPKKYNTMHKRNLPFRTVKAGGKKKREEVDSIVSCFPQISVLKPERCQSGLVSHIHQDQQTFAGYTVYFILNSQWNPVDSPFFPSWSRLMSQFTAHWSSIPPQQQGIYCEWAKHMKGTEVDVWHNCRPSQNLLTCNSSSGLNAQRDCDQAVEPLYCLVIHYIHHYGMSILLTCLCGFAEQDPVWWNNWKHLKET